jgi:hypothetical protein
LQISLIHVFALSMSSPMKSSIWRSSDMFPQNPKPNRSMCPICRQYRHYSGE